MAEEVSLVFSEDAGPWPQYLQDQITNEDTISAGTFLVTDKVLFSSMDSRMETRILKSKVVLVIMTPGHVDYLQQTPTANYDKVVKFGEKGILLLLGIEECEIRSTLLAKKFPDYEQWTNVAFDGELPTIKSLLLKIVDLLEKPESLRCGFSVHPTVLHCEEDQKTVILTIDEPIPEGADVKAVIRGNEINAKTPTKRLNPYTFKLNMPTLSQQQVSVTVEVNGSSLGSHVKVNYKSLIASEDVTAINTIYCHCIDVLCKLLDEKSRFSKVSVEDVDVKLSEIFDHTVDLPIKGFEYLFGIYQNYTEDLLKTELPSMVHLAAKHNLKETVVRLQELPQFMKVCNISNKDRRKPIDIAEHHGHRDIAGYIKDYAEQMEIYAMCVGYVQKGSGYYNVKDKKKVADAPVEAYADMDFYADPDKKSRQSSCPADPSENYMFMGGTSTGSTPNRPDSECSEEYEGVESWQGSGSDEYTGQRSQSVPNDRQDGPALDKLVKSPTAPGALRSINEDSTTAENIKLTGKSAELIKIQQQVKGGQMTVEEAEMSFKVWLKQHDEQGGKSFDEKQAQMKKTRAELTKAKPAQTFRGKLFGTKESKKPAKTSTKPSLVHKESISKPTPFAKEAKPKAPPPPTKEESAYVGRDALPPPVPNRIWAKEPLVPPRDQDMSPRKTANQLEEDPQENYLAMAGEDTEFYDYVEQEDWTNPPAPAQHKYPLPPTPSESLYLDRTSTISNSRLSNISNGSRSSSVSTNSSGRESTASHSSGIEDDYDPRAAKRQSIHDRELPDPPSIPSRSSSRKLPPTPTPPVSPDFHQSENSIPLEAPPPIPGLLPHLASVEEAPEEPAVEEPTLNTNSRADFLRRIGATPIMIGTPNVNTSSPAQSPRSTRGTRAQAPPIAPKKLSKPQWPPKPK